MDSIAAAFCPGVSCPSPIGLDAETALQCCLRAGMCKSVRLMDMSEFNPAVEDYNTGLDETDDKMCSIGFNIFPNGSSTQKWGIYMGIVYLSCPQQNPSRQVTGNDVLQLCHGRLHATVTPQNVGATRRSILRCKKKDCNSVEKEQWGNLGWILFRS